MAVGVVTVKARPECSEREQKRMAGGKSKPFLRKFCKKGGHRSRVVTLGDRDGFSKSEKIKAYSHAEHEIQREDVMGGERGETFSSSVSEETHGTGFNA